MRSDVINMEIEKEELVEIVKETRGGMEEEHNKMCEAMMKYKVDEPYPEIMVQKENKHYAAILSNDFAGAISEMTAVTQYVNHHLKCEMIDDEIGEALIGIGMVEMHHLNMIGETILKLGGEPYYGRVKKDKFQCWTPKFIVYGKDIKSMLKSDIQGEVDAIAQYKKHIEEIDDKYIKALLKRIIKDEEFHIKILDSLLKNSK